MKKLYIIITILFVGSTFANTSKFQDPIKKLYEQGKYEKILDIFDRRPVDNKIVNYWRGLSNIRLNEYDEGIKFLAKSIKQKYNAKDIHYEYGQALYVSERLQEARVAFKQSVKNKYKVAVSLYYIAFISQELKDFKKAVGFYNMIEKLSEDSDKKDVLQASRMQVANIYIDRVEKLPNSFVAVEKYVIPQYQKALEVDENSSLAKEIKQKIVELQRRYDLLLFKMRNGRPTSFPRYFIKGNLSYNIDDNVRNLDDKTKSSNDKKDIESNFINAGVFARYTFYPNSSFSVSPELNISYTNYASDSDFIKTNNSVSYTPGIQVNYEHVYNNLPATTYLKFDYTNKLDDGDADDTLEKASDAFSIELSETLQFWNQNPTTFRYTYTQSDHEETDLSYTTHSLTWEQVVNLSRYTIFLYNSFDLNDYQNDSAASNRSLTIRADFLLPEFYSLFNPNLYISTTQTTYTDNDERDSTSLISYGMNLSRPLFKKIFLNFNYSLEDQSGELSTDTYKGSLISLNLDYYY